MDTFNVVLLDFWLLALVHTIAPFLLLVVVVLDLDLVFAFLSPQVTLHAAQHRSK